MKDKMRVQITLTGREYMELGRLLYAASCGRSTAKYEKLAEYLDGVVHKSARRHIYALDLDEEDDISTQVPEDIYTYTTLKGVDSNE